MKIKTAELTGAALDWAVAKCSGYEIEDYGRYGVIVWQIEFPTGRREFTYLFRPSTDWAQAGWMIEREELQSYVANAVEGKWCAKPRDREYWDFDGAAYGQTLLVAAMRCYVMSRLGDEVDVPEELLP